MSLTTHIKTSVANVQTGEVTYEYYTETEWAALEAAREANRIPQKRARLLSRLKRKSRKVVDQMGDEYTRTKLLMNYFDLRLKTSRTPEEESAFTDLKAIMQFAKDVQTEYLRVKTELKDAVDPGNVGSPTWPDWPPVRNPEEL